MRERRSASIFLGVFALGAWISLSSCSHSPKASSASPPVKTDSKFEVAAEKAVEKTEEDERMAPLIQKAVNALFFHEKEENPGGVDAFSVDRIQELEMALMRSDRAEIKYYVANREFFDRVEDAGGGFRIVANAKRLVPHRWTKTARHKLFRMNLERVKEMIANPCFSEVEECGESASDGDENTAVLDEWVKKYSEKEFDTEREKLLRDYLAVLERYQKKAAKSSSKRAKKGAVVVGTHIRGVQLLLKE